MVTANTGPALSKAKPLPRYFINELTTRHNLVKTRVESLLILTFKMRELKLRKLKWDLAQAFITSRCWWEAALFHLFSRPQMPVCARDYESCGGTELNLPSNPRFRARSSVEDGRRVVGYNILAQDLSRRPNFTTAVPMEPTTHTLCSHLTNFTPTWAHLCPFSFYVWKLFSLPSCFQNYQKSLNDLHKVLLLDPNIIEAKMELEEVTRILNVQDNAALFNKEKERRKIEIEEVCIFGYLWKYSFGDPILIWDSEVIFLWL